MAASGACAVLIGFTFGRSLWLLVPIALAWGFFVIADSAQFSVLVTEAVPPHAVGTALTVQTSIGFLLTMVSIQLVPPVQHVVGWRWAFVMLALRSRRRHCRDSPFDSAANRRAQGLITLAGGRGFRSISLSRWSSRRSVRSCSSRSRSSASRRVEFRRSLIALHADGIEPRSQQSRIRGQCFDLRGQFALPLLGVAPRVDDLIEQRQPTRRVVAILALRKPRNEPSQHIARDRRIERRSFRRAVQDARRIQRAVVVEQRRVGREDASRVSPTSLIQVAIELRRAWHMQRPRNRAARQVRYELS